MDSRGNHDGGSFQAVNWRNPLPNSGGFPLDPAGLDPRRILREMEGSARRRTSVAGFEGFALDDALVFADSYKHFSFLPLAKAITAIAGEHFHTVDVSVLELGCGGGDLFRFLHVLGVRRYLGVDANPLAFARSPWILRHRGHFRLLNLQEEIDFGAIFDVVCAFEVLEHIREDALSVVVRTISRHMGDRSVFLGTASARSDLDVHLTVRDRGYWLNRFREYGLTEHSRSLDYAARLASNHPFNWSAKNTHIFALVKANSP